MFGLLSNAVQNDNGTGPTKKKKASYEPETRTEKNHYPGQDIDDQEDVQLEQSA
jgi:hypothetical protein